MSNNKIFLTALSVAFATGLSIANAQTAGAPASQPSNAKNSTAVKEKITDEAILFKVQDINPVKNSDGKTISCDYTLVFFNRTNNNLSGASIDLVWEDSALNEFSKENNEEKQMARNYSGSSEENAIQASIEVPDILSLNQGVVRSRLQSDSCFILMEEMTIRPKSCNMDLISESGGRTTKSCGKMFRYVAPNSLEYYREFVAETAEQEAKKALTKREKIQQDINTQYNDTVKEFNKASKELSEIK